MVRLEPFLRARQVQIAVELAKVNRAVSERLGAIDHDKWLLILWYYVQELANRKPRSQVVDVAQEDAIAALGVVRMKQAVNNGACIDLIVKDQILKWQDVQRCVSFSSGILKQVQVRRPRYR
jgi:hypothetical protein